MANVTTNNVQDLDFSVLHKKQFRIKGLGDERILELDTSDLSVINRLEESQPKLKNLENYKHLRPRMNLKKRARMNYSPESRRYLLSFVKLIQECGNL